jgi:hypothetical protein
LVSATSHFWTAAALSTTASPPKTRTFSVSWDRCYDFRNIFAKKIGEKIGVFESKTKLNLKKIDRNIGF